MLPCDNVYCHMMLPSFQLQAATALKQSVLGLTRSLSEPRSASFGNGRYSQKVDNATPKITNGVPLAAALPPSPTPVQRARLRCL